MAKRKNKKVADVEEQQVDQIEQAEEVEQPIAPAPKVRPMQLAPIIQPIAFVPYSTQEQDIFSHDYTSSYAANNYDYYNQAGAAREESAYQETSGRRFPEANAKKKVNFASILLVILSLVAIAVIVVGEYAKQDFLYMVNNKSGLAVILDFFKDLANIGLADAVPISIIVMAVCSVLILIGALIRIMKPGACGLSKIGAFLGLTVALVALILSLIEKDTVDVNIGLYIVAGVMLICVLISFGVKSYKK